MTTTKWEEAAAQHDSLVALYKDQIPVETIIVKIEHKETTDEYLLEMQRAIDVMKVRKDLVAVPELGYAGDDFMNNKVTFRLRLYKPIHQQPAPVVS